MSSAEDDAQQSRQAPRGRRPWQELWSNEAGSEISLDEFLTSLPSFSRDRNDSARCRLNHIEHDDAEKLIGKHQMRRILTKCKSTRCKEAGLACSCTYRLLLCGSSNLANVSVDGTHSMTDSMASPKAPQLTVQMQNWIEERLAEDASNVPSDLFGLLVKKIDRGNLSDPPPTVTQVKTFVKAWRKRNKCEAMQPVIDLCLH